MNWDELRSLKWPCLKHGLLKSKPSREERWKNFVTLTSFLSTLATSSAGKSTGSKHKQTISHYALAKHKDLSSVITACPSGNGIISLWQVSKWTQGINTFKTCLHAMQARVTSCDSWIAVATSRVHEERQNQDGHKRKQNNLLHLSVRILKKTDATDCCLTVEPQGMTHQQQIYASTANGSIVKRSQGFRGMWMTLQNHHQVILRTWTEDTKMKTHSQAPVPKLPRNLGSPWERERESLEMLGVWDLLYIYEENHKHSETSERMAWKCWNDISKNILRVVSRGNRSGMESSEPSDQSTIARTGVPRTKPSTAASQNKQQQYLLVPKLQHAWTAAGCYGGCVLAHLI